MFAPVETTAREDAFGDLQSGWDWSRDADLWEQSRAELEMAGVHVWRARWCRRPGGADAPQAIFSRNHYSAVKEPHGKSLPILPEHRDIRSRRF